MGNESTQLAKAARNAAKSGDLVNAEMLYRQLLEIESGHIGALTFLSFIAKEQGDQKTSRDLLQRALDVEPNNPVLWRNLGILEYDADKHDSASSSFEEALALNPKDALSHFYLAEIYETLGQLESATEHYLTVISLQPNFAGNPKNPDISHFVGQVKKTRSNLHASYHENVLVSLENDFPESNLARVRDFVAYHHQKKPLSYSHPLQRPAFQYFPGLDSKPWFDTKEFDWAETAAANTESIQKELLTVINNEQVLSPYVAHQGKVPEEWNELTNSLKWSAYHIYKEGEKVRAHCEQCPETAAMLEQLPLVAMPGQAPEAFFSILRPGAHIPPHFGLANLKLAVHLPLVIPDNCAIRVGDETRQWQLGQCLVFDDSFEHEAWNRSNESRAVLIFEVWNPQLTETEREAMSRLTAATVRFHDFCQKFSPAQ